MVTNLLERARAFVAGLKVLAETKEGTTPVTNQFADEYNQLRSDVATAVPELSTDLPTEINLSADYNKTDAKYVEIFTYALTSFNLFIAYQNKIAELQPE